MEIADYIVAEDRELVDRVLKGDNDAFEYLFNRYRDAIHRLFVQRLGGVNDADDLLQETFIKVYINLHRYSADYTFGQWVYTIARNTFCLLYTSDARTTCRSTSVSPPRRRTPRLPRRASSTSSSGRRSSTISNASRPVTGS